MNGFYGIQTRHERRQLERAKEKHVKRLMSGGFTKFEDITQSERSQHLIRMMGIKPVKIYLNGLFVVQVYAHACEWGECLRVMIRWNDARPDHDWAMFQRIKNELFGESRVALEVYPSEEHKQNVANMYWLFVLPEGFNCPIEIRGLR